MSRIQQSMKESEAAVSEQRNEMQITALQRERAGLVARGLDDRVAQVDEQLKFYGFEDEKPARKQPPQGRSAKLPLQTTASDE